MRQRTGNKGNEIKKGDMETEAAGSEKENERDRNPETEAGPQTNLVGRHPEAGARREREPSETQGDRPGETLPTPRARRADAPCPLPTHILEERVSRGTGGWRGGPRGLGRGLPDQAHGEQPRARHGAAAGSGWAEAAARTPRLRPGIGDWGDWEGAPAYGRRRTRRGPHPTAPPTAQAGH